MMPATETGDRRLTIMGVVSPSTCLISLIVVGVIWSLAFVAFRVVHTPILLSPRRDGKPG